MILIVDDHIDTCRVLLQLLKRDGIPVQCVDDPAAPIRLVESLNPTMLVLDQMMPGLSGTEVLAAIRQVPEVSGIPAIFYAASQEGEAEARRLGALDWIVKGKADWKELRDRIIAVYRLRDGGGEVDASKPM